MGCNTLTEISLMILATPEQPYFKCPKLFTGIVVSPETCCLVQCHKTLTEINVVIGVTPELSVKFNECVNTVAKLGLMNVLTPWPG